MHQTAYILLETQEEPPIKVLTSISNMPSKNNHKI
jgi:hypothetical protein